MYLLNIREKVPVSPKFYAAIAVCRLCNTSPVDVANERVVSANRFTYLGSDVDSSDYCSLSRIGIAVIGERRRQKIAVLDNPTVIWRPSPVQGNSANILINLISPPPETRVIGLHFCCW